MTMRTDRRAALKIGISGAVAAFAAPQIMVRAVHAQPAPAPDISQAGFFRFNLGDFELVTLLDGMRPGEGPHPIFGEDQSAQDMAALMEENFLPADRFANGFTPMLVRAGQELVLFDTGLGEAARDGGLGQLARQLEAAGFSRDDVTIVVLTHFHGDHIGGLWENGSPAFPNARYIAGQAEYDFSSSPDRLTGPTEGNARAVAEKVVPLAERMTFIGDGEEVVSGMTAMAAFGHTPGHMIYMLESGGKQLVLTADTANHFVASLRRPDWHVRFDMDKDAASQTRRRVFDMVATDRLPFVGYHMPWPSLGYVEKLETGYRYVPHSYQLLL